MLSFVSIPELGKSTRKAAFYLQVVPLVKLLQKRSDVFIYLSEGQISKHDFVGKLENFQSAGIQIRGFSS